MSWSRPKKVNATAPVAIKGVAIAPGAGEPRERIAAGTTTSTIKFVTRDIFTSGARVKDRKKASAIAAVSSGTPGTRRSIIFFLRRRPVFSGASFLTGFRSEERRVGKEG